MYIFHLSRDRHGCANRYKGGWWYKACHRVNFNGIYWNLPEALKTTSYATGFSWYCYKGHHYSYKRVEILIAIDANNIEKLAA